MSRRSERLRGIVHHNSLNPNQENEVVLSNDGSRDPDYKPPRTRVHGQQNSKVSGKRYLHQFVTDAPMDIVFEIFQYLEPLDILHLARTCRNIRAVLVAQSSEFVWRAARTNIEGLPPLPPDLNEIQFADLLFFHSCQVCGRYCENVIWDCRIRAHKKCTKQVLVSVQELRRLYPNIWKFPRVALKILECTPQEELRKSGNYASEFEHKWLYFVHSTMSSEETLASMKSARTIHLRHVSSCARWQDTMRSQRAQKLDEIRQQTKENIMERLRALGWDQEIQQITSSSPEFLTNLNIVRKPHPLTERGWQGTYPQLVEVLQKQRRRNALEARYRQLKDMYNNFTAVHELAENGYPPFGDIIETDLFQTVIYCTPFDINLVADNFSGGFAQIPSFSQSWRSKKSQELLDLLRPFLPHATLATLELASTVFICLRCLQCLWYPLVFNHGCLSTNRSYHCGLHTDTDFNPHRLFAESPWNTGASRTLVYYTYGSIMMKGILRSCDFPTERVKAKELDQLNIIFECKTCRNSLGRLFMHWRHTISHNANQCTTAVHSYSARSYQRHKEVILDQEKFSRTFHCSHCPGNRRSNMSIIDLKMHLKTQHKIDSDIVETSHWVWAPDTELRW